MKRFLGGFWLAVILVSPASADRIALVADQWCPYNCTPGTDRPGYLVEAATLALAQAGHEVVYLTIPWNRAISTVREGVYQGLIGAGKQETPDFVFPPVPLATARHSFYTEPYSTWTYSGYASLREIRIAVIKDYSYGTLYRDYIAPNEQNNERITVLYGENIIARLMVMLERGWVDAFIEDRAVFNHYLKRTGDDTCFRNAGVVLEEDIYIAFSPASADSPRYARDLAAGLRNLERSGTLDSLRAVYFPKSTEPQLCE